MVGVDDWTYPMLVSARGGVTGRLRFDRTILDHMSIALITSTASPGWDERVPSRANQLDGSDQPSLLISVRHPQAHADRRHRI